jgi:uncharacterized membrane protein YfcA
LSGLSAADIAWLAAAAVGVGFAKTAIGGVGPISVATFAAILPARESTGALLPLLLVGDVIAVSIYRRHAEWPVLLRLFPSVAVGIVAGAIFIANVSDDTMRRTIGVVLLVLVAAHIWQRRSQRNPTRSGLAAGAAGQSLDAVDASSRWLDPRALAFGVLAGFTTMVANAAGAVMALYLLTAGLTMVTFLGTTAWFFLIVNAFKVPFTAGLGLISGQSLLLDAALVPAVIVGAWLGRVVIRRLSPQRFEQIILIFVVIAGLNLLR